MKIVHFCIFAPHGNGQFGTVRDLISAEKAVGIDAGFVDYGYKSQNSVRTGLKDGNLESLPLEWVYDADIVMRHSAIPPEVERLGIPVLTALHGRPESSSMLELYGERLIISEILKIKDKANHAGFLTFWKEYLPQWSVILGGEEIAYVPSPINLAEYEEVNRNYNFAWKSGYPNVVVADVWRGRRDVTPFNVLMAASLFKQKFENKAKVHVYALPDKGSLSFLDGLKEVGVLGETRQRIKGLKHIFGSADMLITPHVIATRLVREAMAIGLPFVAGHGCKYTKYHASGRNIELFANEMKRCLDGDEVEENIKLREKMKIEFGIDNVGGILKNVLEKTLNNHKREKSLKEKPIAMSKEIVIKTGQIYCNSMNKGEHKKLRTKRRNERAIEYKFVFNHLAKSYPSTVLDVGSGMSSLPHLMSLGGFEVDAVDNTDKSCWPNGFFNRHFMVEHDDIINTKISKHYDFITCISVLEHISEHKKAVKNMFGLLNLGGRLLITCPYNEEEYIENVYKLEGAGYGQDFPYICQVYSRKEIDKWLEGTNYLVRQQEYWKVFHGKFWTFGRQFYPPVETSSNELHQLTCLLLEKK